MIQYSFRKPISIDPPTLPKTELLVLADTLANEEVEGKKDVFGSIPKNYKTPRLINEIIDDIEAERFENISLIEWVYCISKKEEWDVNQPIDKQLSTARKYWNAAKAIHTVRIKMFWSLALHFDSKEPRNLSSFAKTLYELDNDFLEHQSTLKLLNILNTSSSNSIIQLAFFYKKSPKQMYKEAGLPFTLNLIIESYQDAVEELLLQSPLSQEGIDWLLSCLNEMTLEIQLSSVEAVLRSIDPEVGKKYPKLLHWLSSEYGAYAKNSKWNLLSSESHKVLRKWIGAANYSDFEKLITIIRKNIKLENWESSQLNSRKYFWSHYSDQFERLRILIPQSTLEQIGKVIHSNFKNIDILLDDGSVATEVCIFDFGNWLVIEFFRGVGSETRLINQHLFPDVKSLLFDSEKISIKQLRSLKAEVHDHKVLWQIFCEGWLRDRGIRPNEGLTHFYGPTRKDKYDPTEGLPCPDSNDNLMIKRRRDLPYWERDVRQLEQEALEWH